MSDILNSKRSTGYLSCDSHIILLLQFKADKQRCRGSCLRPITSIWADVYCHPTAPPSASTLSEHLFICQCQYLFHVYKTVPSLFAVMTRYCTSQLRICNLSTLSTSCWSCGKEQDASPYSHKLTLVVNMYRGVSLLSFVSSSHLIASAHRELPVKGSPEAVAQVQRKQSKLIPVSPLKPAKILHWTATMELIIV